MTDRKESSVVFALDQLREQERERIRREDDVAQRRAAVARRQAAAAAQKREDAKKNAEELERLRSEVTLQDARHIELQRTIARLEAEAAAKPRIYAPAPAPAPTHVVRQSSAHHLVWGAALLVSCLAVFVMSYSPEPGTTTVVAAVPEACPEVAPNIPDARAAPMPKTEAPPVATREVAKPAPSPKRPRPKPPRGTKPAKPVESSLAAEFADCDTPLCGIPE